MGGVDRIEDPRRFFAFQLRRNCAFLPLSALKGENADWGRRGVAVNGTVRVSGMRGQTLVYHYWNESHRGTIYVVCLETLGLEHRNSSDSHRYCLEHARPLLQCVPRRSLPSLNATEPLNKVQILWQQIQVGLDFANTRNSR